MKIKTLKLTGAALNYAIAKANGWVDYPEDSIEQGNTWHMDADKSPFGAIMKKSNWNPLENWAQGGPIIEREKIAIKPKELFWEATAYPSQYMQGETPLVAAMRCYVAGKLGDEVDIPEELA